MRSASASSKKKWAAEKDLRYLGDVGHAGTWGLSTCVGYTLNLGSLKAAPSLASGSRAAVAERGKEVLS